MVVPHVGYTIDTYHDYRAPVADAHYATMPKGAALLKRRGETRRQRFSRP